MIDFLLYDKYFYSIILFHIFDGLEDLGAQVISYSTWLNPWKNSQH